MKALLLWTTMPLAATAAVLALAGGPVQVTASPPAPTPAPAAALPLSDAEIAGAAATIDRMVLAGLQHSGQKPNPRIDDATFLRRAYLQIAGRIPTHAEASAFLQSGSSDKRRTLVEQLMGSEAWASSEFNWWADLLRLQTRAQNRPMQPYIDWVKEAIRSNKPYDQMVRELLVAEGAALERGNGATGFWVRDAGMPLDHLSNAVQVFLGTRMQCAQCHDHPFDTWTRYQFYQLAAFTHGTQVNRNPRALGGMDPKEAKRTRERIQQEPQEVQQVLRQYTQMLAISVKSGQKPSIPLPHDYQYKDHKPHEQVAPKALFGPDATVEKGGDPRQVLAAWMTSPENPRFATVIANRLWKRTFGVGLIEPVDDLKDTTVASDPALMEFLARLMVSVKYDLRRFQGALYATEAWQRAATAEEPAPGAAYRFAGPALRRLRAEQLWDSLLALAVDQPEANKGPDAENLHAFYDENREKTVDDLLLVARGIADVRKERQQLQQQLAELRAKGGAAKDPALAKELREQQRAMNEKMAELGVRSEPIVPAKPKLANGRPGQERWLRASELPQPAPLGHILRVFGQSDREVIDNAVLEPTVPQALMLLNGFVDQQLALKTSALSRTVAAESGGEAKIRAMYISILSRPPRPEELNAIKQHAAATATPDQVIADVAWALINSREFLFIQ